MSSSRLRDGSRPAFIVCSDCGRVKAATVENFRPRGDWLRGTCRECQRLRGNEQAARWRAVNPEKSYAMQRDWVKRNREKSRAFSREHANRRRAEVASHEPVDSLAILREFGWICHLCGNPVPYFPPGSPYDPQKLEMDHVIPLAKGGTHTKDNIRPSHARCNRKKFTKLGLDFEREVISIEVPPEEIGHKLCVSCGQIKELTAEFWNNSTRQGWRQPCRECRRIPLEQRHIQRRGGEKRCTRCREWKPETEEFYRPRDGCLQSQCIGCQRERAKENYLKNPQAAIDRAVRWAAANPDKVLASRQSRAPKNNARTKAWNERRKAQ